MRKLFSLILLAVATACTDTSAPEPSLAGVYALRSFDGDPVPATVFQDGEDFIRVESGSITLDGDGTFRTSATMSYRIEGVTGTETGGIEGTYSRSGNLVHLTDTEGEVYVVEYDGEAQLTMREEGSVVVYRK